MYPVETMVRDRMFGVAVVIALLLPFSLAFAQDAAPLTVSPVVIDEKAKARDILKQTVILKNNSDRKLSVYPSVNDIDPSAGEEGFVSAQDSEDRSASLANWIELSRVVIELEPGAEKEVPFVIRVNMNAVANTYHAQITFAEGGDRNSAESRGSLARVTVNLEVQADIKELLQLNKFITDNVFFSGDDVLFNYQLENIGNQELLPRGEIRIYNRKGEEVASIPVNGDSKTISPENMTQMASVWSAVQGFGKFKAFLTIDYGKTQTASVQDTIYFWIIPWQQLLAVFVGSLIAVIVSAFYFHRYLERRHVPVVAGVAAPLPEAAAPTDWMKKDPLWKRLSRPVMYPVSASLSLIMRVVPKRRAKIPTEPAPMPAVAAAPTPPPAAVATPTPAPAQAQPAPVAPVAHTIDLKRARPAAPDIPASKPASIAENHGHVINLKRK